MTLSLVLSVAAVALSAFVIGTYVGYRQSLRHAEALRDQLLERAGLSKQS